MTIGVDIFPKNTGFGGVRKSLLNPPEEPTVSTILDERGVFRKKSLNFLDSLLVCPNRNPLDGRHN
jgi:hypothetical protein